MRGARWIHGPVPDTALALAWVPFAVIAANVHGSTLVVFMSAVLLLSFCHQPLTVLMVYGDPDTFRLRPTLFVASPLMFVVAVLVGVHVSLALVAVVGGLWNAEHTLMQRYGLTRIYGRKGGDDHGAIERAMLFSWLALALVWAAADSRTPGLIESSGLTGTNRQGIEVLASMAPYARLLVVPVAAVVVALVVRWVRLELRLGSGGNPAKHLYLGSTALLFAVAVVHPIAGLAAYVGSHAVEYFVIVNRSFAQRYQSQPGGGPLGSTVRRLRRTGFFVFYAAGVVVLALTIERIGARSLELWAVLFFGIGGMHVLYDGFIWKLRQPRVATSLDVPV